jgi:hypothetical protein
LWEKTSRINKFNPIILGLEDKREIGHESAKFGLKFILLAQYLQSLPPHDLCLVTDGFDVIFHGAHDLESRLQNLPSHQLLFAADVFENPDQGYPYQTQFLRAPYLNSGVYAGRAWTILAVLRLALEAQDPLAIDDQRYFTEYMFKNPGTIVIDHAFQHFACTAGLEYKKDFGVKEGRLHVLGNFPCVLHFQGFSKDTRIINELFNDPEIIMLGSKLHRMPSPWGKAIGDGLVMIGSFLPIRKQYRIHAGICITLMILISLLSAINWEGLLRKCCFQE